MEVAGTGPELPATKVRVTACPTARGGRGATVAVSTSGDASGSLTPACMSMVTWAIERRVICRADPSTNRAALANRAKASTIPATAARARRGFRSSDLTT